MDGGQMSSVIEKKTRNVSEIIVYMYKLSQQKQYFVDVRPKS